ncbi:MAG: hypothetical protein QXM86_02070 [Candidatus Bathyarchaeia archaeon]
MNWKNVLHLIKVDVKASRVVRGTRFRRFTENKIITYALYIAACAVGLLVGFLIGNFYNGINDPNLKQTIFQGATNSFITLPTIALLYGLVFTQMSQFQRIGAKVTIQPLYWFPITWKEHTMASILANIIGAPLLITTSICPLVLVASVFLGLVPLATFTVFALLASLFLASATTEVFKILQVRISGAVTKAAGRAAVWIRLLGSIIFFILFYIAYFSLYYNVSFPVLIELLAGGQRMLWFIPYLWLGIALSAFTSRLWLETIVSFMAALCFIYLIFHAAVSLNTKFGLYEMPSMKISTGAYIPKVGFLGKLGFSSLEAALIKKDFKAFTRRRELMYIFVMPIVIVIVPIMSLMRGTTEQPLPTLFYTFLFAYLTMAPGVLMSIMLGSIILGSEGESVWQIHASPISAKNLVKAKYFFAALFSLAVALVCSVVAVFLAFPSLVEVTLFAVETVLLIFSLSMVSLSFGIKGADFRVLPRPRMIRPLWSFINTIVCLVLALVIASPIIPFVLKMFFESMQAPVKISLPISEYYLFFALPLSVVIAAVITYLFYRKAVKNAEEFLSKAQA